MLGHVPVAEATSDEHLVADLTVEGHPRHSPVGDDVLSVLGVVDAPLAAVTARESAPAGVRQHVSFPLVGARESLRADLAASTTTPVRCASGCVVECRICNREVAGSNLGLGYFAPRSTQPSIPPGSVNENQMRLGRQRQVWLIPIADERVGVQVKL